MLGATISSHAFVAFDFPAEAKKSESKKTRKWVVGLLAFGWLKCIKIKRYQRLAVAVDTSGSIKENDFVIFFNEIHSMWKQGAEIEVLECDAEKLSFSW